jgi:four helix bundle protein
MNEQAEELKRRSKKFALDVLSVVRTLPRTDEARSISGQLIRSSTGVAANYRAVCRSRSDAEFVARIGVALEEADESALWLEILTESRIAESKEAYRLLDEADQLSAIFAQSRLTALENLEKHGNRIRSQSVDRAYYKTV